MELLFLIPIFGLLAIYVAYRDWLSVAYRQWLSELDLFKKRLAVYEQLKSAVERVRANDSVSNADIGRFARALSEMRFLFDEDLERFINGIYGGLLKKHALDALIEKAAGQDKSLIGQALIEQAQSKSRQLTAQITNAIYRDLPGRMENFMRPRPLPSPTASSSAALQPSLDR
jgi:hypothetical protein